MVRLLFTYFDRFKELKDFQVNYFSPINIAYDIASKELKLLNIESSTPVNFYGQNVDPINVIVGKNGVGKTQYMEYLCSYLGNYYIRSIVAFQFVNEPNQGENSIVVFYQRNVELKNKVKELVIDGVTFPIIYKEFSENANEFYQLIEQRFKVIYLTNALSVKSFFPQRYCINESTTFLIERAKTSEVLPMLNANVINKLDNYLTFNLRELKRQLKVFNESPDIPEWVFGKKVKKMGFYFDTSITNPAFSWVQLVLNRLSQNDFFAKKIKSLAEGEIRHDTWVTSSDNDLKLLFLLLMLYFKNEVVTQEVDDKTKQYTSIVYRQLSQLPIDKLNALIIAELQKFTTDQISDIEEINAFISYLSKDEILKSLSIQINISAYTLGYSFVDFFSVQYEIDLGLANDLIDRYFSILSKKNEKFLWFSWGFSSGEMALMALFARILAHSSQIENDKTVLLLLDEAEIYLHPEWQQKFLLKYLIFLQKFLGKNRIQILITTHSPIILSDCTHENVNYIYRDNAIQESVMEKREDKIFGATIYSLYKNLFFLDKGFIGEFSEDKINQLIDFLVADEKIKKKEGDINSMPFEFKDDSFKSTMRVVGDKLIYTKLMEYYLKKVKGEEEFVKRIKKKYEDRNNLFSDLDIE